LQKPWDFGYGFGENPNGDEWIFHKWLLFTESGIKDLSFEYNQWIAQPLLKFCLQIEALEKTGMEKDEEITEGREESNDISQYFSH
jgi:hypothetical protein